MWWYKQVLRNCKKATFLLEKKNAEGIGHIQEIELRIHLKGCYICRRYNDQSQLINQMVQQFYEYDKNSTFTLDDSFKNRLRDTIEKELK